MTTISQLESRIDHLNKITNSPATPYTRTKDEPLKANIGNYHLSQAYGGYSLYQMTSKGGAVNCPVGSYHMPKRELIGKINAFISGVEEGKS